MRPKFITQLRSASSIIVLASIFFAGHPASAKVEYDSNSLQMKNSEEFTAIVKKKIKLASNIQSRQKLDLENGLIAEPEAVAYLTDALRIVLSRTDQDASVDDLFSSTRHELQDLNSFDDSVRSLTNEAVQALKDDGTPVRIQGTYNAILNNLIAQIKPDLRIGNGLYKIVDGIKDARLKVSDKLKNQAFLRSMGSPVSPSETAKTALATTKPDTQTKDAAQRSNGETKVDRKKSKNAPKDSELDED